MDRPDYGRLSLWIPIARVLIVWILIVYISIAWILIVYISIAWILVALLSPGFLLDSCRTVFIRALVPNAIENKNLNSELERCK